MSQSNPSRFFVIDEEPSAEERERRLNSIVRPRPQYYLPGDSYPSKPASTPSDDEEPPKKGKKR